MNSFDISSEEFHSIRYDVYKDLRLKEPVYWYEKMNTWLVMKYDDIMPLLKSDILSTDYLITDKIRNAPKPLDSNVDYITSTIRQWMIYNDAPTHTRLRKYMNRVFSKQHITGVIPEISSIINQRVTTIDINAEFDFVSQFAHPVPAQILAKMIGLEEISLDKFIAWSDAIADFMQDFVVSPIPNTEIAAKTVRDLHEMKMEFKKSIEIRKVSPKKDLLTDLVTGLDSYEEGITQDELILQLIHLIFGGHKIPQFVMSNVVHCLLKNEKFLHQTLNGDNPPIFPVVEEVMRYESPIQFITRHAKEDFMLKGKKIKKGDSVFLMLGSANRDEDKFDAPEIFNPFRTRGRHVSFGGGIHTCVGAALVNAELKEIFNQLFKGVSAIKAQYDLEKPMWSNNATFHGIKEQVLSLK